MFEAEADGLRELAAANEVRVPAVLACGVEKDRAYLMIERLQLERPSDKVQETFGQQLARLHRHTSARFGWWRDNTIGLTPQINEQRDDWIDFFRRHRLEYQVDLAVRNGFDLRLQGERLSARLDDFFVDYNPVPSLLHGDLWAGNWGSADGEPVIFDPAVYYGDRESDIAMTMLFGGFGRRFYEAYNKEWPMEAGHEKRLSLYRLYHVLNHLNLFGRSYLGQSRQLLDELGNA